jgi:hypothetical protein
MSPRVRTEGKGYVEQPNWIRTGVTRSHLLLEHITASS